MMLLVGGDSEIGAATYRSLQAQGLPVAATTRRADRIAPDRPFLDLAAELNDWAPPPGTRSACIFLAIARLADCANDPAGSARINVTQTLKLIDWLVAQDVHVVFLSTNQVFDGMTPHVRADAPACPVSEYGRQKARAEAHLRAHLDRGAPLAILRLGKVVSPVMPLIDGWVKTLSAGKPIQAFRDMPLAPAPVGMATDAIVRLMHDRLSGVYQLTGPRDASYAEIGRFLADRLGADAKLVTETSARDAGLPEGSTPHHTTLDSSGLRERYGLEVPDITAIIAPMIAAAKS
jgi:nucleoside-diphosphate-sugar epimerase